MVEIISSSEDEEGVRQSVTASRPDEPLNLITTESDSDQGPGVNHILYNEHVE